MSQCPVCGAEITEDFGIVECESCQAQLVIHLDGRVEHAGAAVISSEDDPAFVSGDEVATQMHEDVPTFIEPMREFDPEPDDSLGGPPPLPEPVQVPIQSYEYTPSEGEALDLTSHIEVEDPLSILDQQDEVAAESYVSAKSPAPAMDSPDLADVARFANSPDSGGRDGSLRYTLFIEGIDTADVRDAFKEAITDKKLLWDTESILRSIRRGEVKIENVSSAKAHVVVTRLKLLPLTVSWEQHAIHEG